MIQKLPSIDHSVSLHAYRAYLLNEQGRFMNVIELFCRDDEDAIEQARRLANDHAVEIWERDRKVALIPASNS
ncbi:MAG TPA: hypothetical protein VEZ24_09400 [Microvirga sp.]|nr:hypothetical protein [Microvirga sp.]